MTPLEVLRAARALLADPLHWTQGKAARNAAGAWVHPRDDKAVCWCALGAVAKFTADEMVCHRAENLLGRAALALGVGWGSDPLVPPPAYLNDSRSHGDVLAMFDRAIALVQKETP